MEKVKLIEICNPKQWKTLSTNELKDDGEYLVYGANGIIGSYNTYNHEKETVLITCRGATCGNIHISKEKSYINGNAMALDDLNEKICLKRYLYYFLKQYDMKKIISGSAQPQITVQSLKKVYIKLYDKDIQNEIINKLDKVQEIIDIRKKQIEELDILIKSQFVEMFESKDYNKATIGKCAKFQGGYAFKSKDFVENGVKLVQISNVNKDTLDWIEINRVPESFIEKYKEYSLVANDVVMAMTRPIIKSLNEVKIAQVREDDLPCLLNQRVGRFIINDSVNKEYLTYCCKSDKFKNYVEKMSGNSLQPNISSKQVENFEISLPPIELQNKFAEFVKQIDKQKFEIQKSLEETQKLQESLMNKYFN